MINRIVKSGGAFAFGALIFFFFAALGAGSARADQTAQMYCKVSGQWVPCTTFAVTGTFWPYTLGQQVAGSSVPVVLTAAQLSTLTPPAAITNYANETGGNLAIIAGAVSSSKMATKAASGDFADGSNVTQGSKADAKSTATDTTAITIMQVLKEISAMEQSPASRPPFNTGTSGTTPANGTIAVTNTFQSVLAANAARKGCLFQNQGLNLMYVFFGSNGSATKATSFQVSPGQPLGCNVPGIVLGDNVSVTGTAGDAWIITSQ